MKKVIFTSSGIKITMESNSNNSAQNLNAISKTISDYYECIEKEKCINQEVLFETKLITAKSMSLYGDHIQYYFNKRILN